MIGEHEQLTLRIASTQVLLAAAIFTIFGYMRRTRAVEPRDTQIEFRLDENERVRTVRLRPPLRIGRNPESDLQIDDVHTSRLHALVDVAGGHVFIEDLGSRNGTFVNARPIDGRVDLAPNDEIRIGGARIIYGGEVPWT